jgi:hypothetical protein
MKDVIFENEVFKVYLNNELYKCKISWKLFGDSNQPETSTNFFSIKIKCINQNNLLFPFIELPKWFYKYYFDGYTYREFSEKNNKYYYNTDDVIAIVTNALYCRDGEKRKREEKAFLRHKGSIFVS